MDKIKKFIECLLPVTACNLRCSYCYVIQEERRKDEIPNLKHPPEYIGKSLTKERLGGTCYFSICGAGETLLPKQTIEIVKAILDQGHYVNVTTNGTLSSRFDEIIKWDKSTLERLHFSFSFHYLELIKTKNLEIFFANIKKVKDSGCSILVQINLCDEYVPHLEEIKRLCLENVGALPQVAATRDELSSKIKILTEYSDEEYNNIGQKFESGLFNFTMENFMKKRCEFCYAGEWAFALNLATGELKQCYFQDVLQDIYENIDKPIKTRAVGNRCKNAFCTNSSHFMSLGIIPEIETPTYVDLRNRVEGNWYNEKMYNFLSGKLYESNNEYLRGKKILTNIEGDFRDIARKIKYKIWR